MGQGNVRREKEGESFSDCREEIIRDKSERQSVFKLKKTRML